MPTIVHCSSFLAIARRAPSPSIYPYPAVFTFDPVSYRHLLLSSSYHHHPTRAMPTEMEMKSLRDDYRFQIFSWGILSVSRLTWLCARKLLVLVGAIHRFLHVILSSLVDYMKSFPPQIGPWLHTLAVLIGVNQSLFCQILSFSTPTLT